LTALIDAAAQETRKQGERPASAFSRYSSAPENLLLRQAMEVTKGQGVARPSLLESTAADDVTDDAVDMVTENDDDDDEAECTKAYDALMVQAEELRKTAPQLSTSQAFARAAAASPDLISKAHRRPVAR
jgi:hypothetical protein